MSEKERKKNLELREEIPKKRSWRVRRNRMKGRNRMKRRMLV
jgi:hypothetical protein